MESDLEDAGGEGFRRLFDYISGENTKKQSIYMTAPFEQEDRSEKIAMTPPASQEKTGNRWRVTLPVPAK